MFLPRDPSNLGALRVLMGADYDVTSWFAGTREAAIGRGRGSTAAAESVLVSVVSGRIEVFGSDVSFDWRDCPRFDGDGVTELLHLGRAEVVCDGSVSLREVLIERAPRGRSLSEVLGARTPAPITARWILALAKIVRGLVARRAPVELNPECIGVRGMSDEARGSVVEFAPRGAVWLLCVRSEWREGNRWHFALTAPEVLRGERHCDRECAAVWSLGALGYWLHHGVPFVPDTAEGATRAAVVPRPIAWSHPLAQALSPSPNERPGFDALIAALELEHDP